MNNFNFIKIENKDYILNFYRKEKYKNKKNLYLITNDCGEFIFLNSDAFYQLKKGKIKNEELYNKLINKSIIINDTNFNSTLKKTAKRYDFLNSSPSLHIVIPTRRCNQGCTYCFATPDKITANKKDCDMNIETAKKTIEFIMKSPSSVITIEFTGGEALIRFDLIKIMTKYAKKLNKKYKKDLKLTIVTNLTLMNDEIANWLIDNNVAICTSLDGPKKVHNKNRFILGLNGKKNIGSYDLVITWIEKLNKIYKRKEKNLQVNALMTITKYSLKYYKEIIDLYVKLNLKVIDLRGMMAIGKGNINYSTDDLSYSFKEFENFYNKSISYIDDLKKKGIQIEDRMKQLYDIKILENKPTYHTDYESPAGAGIATLTYYNDGNIFSTHEALGRDEFKLGNIFSSTYKSIFKTKEASFTILSSMIESNVICDRCVLKPYCSTIPIENYYSQGKFNFNPYKTTRHFETKFHSENIFDKELKKLNL